MDSADPFVLLGVSPDASSAEVREAWKRLARTYHPDRFVGASPEERLRAEAHMTIINAAYEDIRSGRARRERRRDEATGGPSGFGRAAAAGPATAGSWAGGDGRGAEGPRWTVDEPVAAPWLDDDVVDGAMRRLRDRRRRRSLRQAMVWGGAVLALLAVGLLTHWSLSRTYGFEYVYDGEGNSYADVDCGTRYDRGQSTAEELRREAQQSGRSALYHQADVVEQVCGDWTRDLGWLAGMGVVAAAGVLWYVLLRRRAPRW